MGKIIDKEKRIWRKANGICIYCGRKKPAKDAFGCEVCLVNKVAATKKFNKDNPTKQAVYLQKNKKIVIEKYGGRCECCGEDCFQFLVIDHKNGDGGVERRKLFGHRNGGSYAWYLKLKKEPRRTDLRVLCHNCNMSIAFYGACPHQGDFDPCFCPLLITDAEKKIIISISQGQISCKQLRQDKSLLLAGVLSSLCKKGLIWKTGKWPNSIYAITEAGSRFLICKNA